MFKEFSAKETEHAVRNITCRVTPVFSDKGKEDLTAKMKRLILDENPCKNENKHKKRLGSDC